MRYRLHTLLIVLALGPPVLAQHIGANPLDLANAGKMYLVKGDWEHGFQLLQRADKIASKGMKIPDFLGSANPELLPEDQITFGIDQVRTMLIDRPNMAKNMGEDDAVFRWTARQFAGEGKVNRL